MESHLIKFYIRNKSSAALQVACAEAGGWQSAVVGGEKVEVTSLMYKPSRAKTAFRVVSVRTAIPTKQPELFTGQEYKYRCIITNDAHTPDMDVIAFYNQRGASENVNKSLLEDFNMSRVPHPDMDTNTVFMYFCCLANTLYEWLKSVLVRNGVEGAEQGMRTKTLLNKYIAVVAEWVEKGLQKTMTIFSDRKYKVLQI